MYSFNVFKKADVGPCADAVAFGVGAGLLPASVVPEFEEYMIASKRIDGSPELLVFEGSSEQAVAGLAKAGYADDGRDRDVLRYTILTSLDSEDQEFLVDIESVYVDFGYPRDMEPII